MHLLIPFAGTVNEAGLQAQAALELPRLQALLGRLTETRRDEGDETSLSPPHERAHAEAIGLAGADGCIPWAAHWAALDGIDTGSEAVGLLTPTHWQVGSDHVALLDPEALALDAEGSRAAFDAMRELFESEGLAMRWGAPLRWYVQHPSLAELPTASLDRVIGRSIESWLPPRGVARLMRRLQNEVQMLLYTHPVTEAREAAGALPVNSFWISGCGVRQPAREGSAPQIDAGLRNAALAGDWTAWAQAWRQLDAGALEALDERSRSGDAVQLTLCGERAAVTFGTQSLGLMQRLRRKLQPLSAPALLATL